MTNTFELDNENQLEHHGVLGQKWGIRRYQNNDGSLTSRGLKRQQKANHKTAKVSASFKLDAERNRDNATKLSAKSKDKKASKLRSRAEKQEQIAKELDKNLTADQKTKGVKSVAGTRAALHGVRSATLAYSSVVSGIGTITLLAGAAVTAAVPALGAPPAGLYLSAAAGTAMSTVVDAYLAGKNAKETSRAVKARRGK